MYAIRSYYDLGYVGEIVNVNTKPILNALDNGYIPVIATVASGEDGQVYNRITSYNVCYTKLLRSALKINIIHNIPPSKCTNCISYNNTVITQVLIFVNS